MSTQSKDKTDTLGQDEPISAPAFHLLLPLNILPISHLLLPLSVLPISHLLLPLKVLPISHLLLVLLDIHPISDPNLVLLLQLLYPKCQETEAKLNDQIVFETKKEKVNTPSDENNTNQKRAVSRKAKAKQRRKKPLRPRNGKAIEKPMTKKECTLEAEVIVDLDHGLTPFDIFQTVTRMNELLKIIVTETNRYAAQKVCNSETTEDKMKAFLGINSVMGISKLPSLKDYWSRNKCIRN